MKKIIDGTKVSFYENDNLIMYLDHYTDEFIWYFNTSELTITSDMEIYEHINSLMEQNYKFNENSVLKNYKDENKLVWYSDCYYDPDDEWSRDDVNRLVIKRTDDTFKIKCNKPLDKILNRGYKSYPIIFSPLGNGQYATNIESKTTLQDDVVVMIYQKLLEKEKIKKLH